MLLDGAGQPIPRPSSPLHEGEGEDAGVVAPCDVWAGDMGVLLDGAGQPIPRPSRLSQEGEGEGEDGGVVAPCVD